MLAGLKRALAVVVVGEVGRGDVNSIDFRDELIEIGVSAFQLELLTEFFGFVFVGIKYRDNFTSVYSVSGTKRFAMRPQPITPSRMWGVVSSRSIVDEMPSVRGR